MAMFVITKRKNNEFQFVLKAGNGETILVSEGYRGRAACSTGISSVKKNAGIDKHFERKQSVNGMHYFNLKATNGRVIGTSEMYKSIEGMEAGIVSVMNNAPVAVEDNQTLV